MSATYGNAQSEIGVPRWDDKNRHWYRFVWRDGQVVSEWIPAEEVDPTWKPGGGLENAQSDTRKDYISNINAQAWLGNSTTYPNSGFGYPTPSASSPANPTPSGATTTNLSEWGHIPHGVTYPSQTYPNSGFGYPTPSASSPANLTPSGATTLDTPGWGHMPLAVAYPSQPQSYSIPFRPQEINSFPSRPLKDTLPSHHEALDPSYRVRDRSFFHIGRVFALLHTEPAGQSSRSMPYSDSISAVRFGESVYTQIRRFVVVAPKLEFCYACPIFTYSKRATLKHGVRPEQHAIIYSWGNSPILLAGETGITKSSIEIVNSEGVPPLPQESRVYFGLHQPIQYNVKVKELGYVIPDHMGDLVKHWRDELLGDMQQASQWPEAQKQSDQTSGRDSPPVVPISRPILPSLAQDHVHVSHLLGAVDSTFEQILHPKGFFKKGRVFMTLWAEPQGYRDADKITEDRIEVRAFAEFARFVVIRTKSTHCLCLRVSTYNGQATTKPGVVPEDHAAVVPVGTDPVEHWNGENLPEGHLEIKVENQDVTISPMSRINFSRVYTIEYNIRVRNIGRIFTTSMDELEKRFLSSLNI